VILCLSAKWLLNIVSCKLRREKCAVVVGGQFACCYGAGLYISV